MALRHGSWLVQLDGYPPVSTDDLTLDELEVAEKACGVPYTLMDPHVSIRIAKALLAVLLIRAGGNEAEALADVGKLSVKRLHRAFTYVPADKPRPAEGDPADPPSSAPTSVTG